MLLLVPLYTTTAPIATVHAGLFELCDPVLIWIRMTNTMSADAFHDTTVSSPVLWKRPHGMIRHVVNGALLPIALIAVMNHQVDIRVF